MSDQEIHYPALYESASAGSSRAQKVFWWTIRIEYFLLFCVSVASATRDVSGISAASLTTFLIILAGIFVYKVYRKPDQEWYRCRALAESIKTSTWRFSMRAHPFGDAQSVEKPKREFRNRLQSILEANKHVAESLQASTSDQVTQSMILIRQMPLEERRDFYVKHRIDEQRAWYTRKSSENKRAFKAWIVVTIIIYIFAAISINSSQLGFPMLAYAFDPLIVIITSAIGWLQMKRHSELAASYNLTAHEIGIVRGDSDYIQTEGAFSDFVNEAELAFSREHTQWVARRDVN